MKRLMAVFFVASFIGSTNPVMAQDLNRTLDEAREILDGVTTGMLKVDVVNIGKRKEVATKLRLVANELVRFTPGPGVLPAPQAPTKVLPAPRAPSKTLPMPQGPGKTLPSPQAPGSPISEFSRVALRTVLDRLADELDDNDVDETSPGNQQILRERAIQGLGLISLIQNQP